jgi:hypothetical protein
MFGLVFFRTGTLEGRRLDGESSIYTMSAELVCWKCGAGLKGVPQPFSRRAQCSACGAELHVCRMCVLYNPRVSDRCDEPRAEHPRETDRANFCDYFKPRPNAYVPPDSDKARAARAKVEALFGGGGSGGGSEVASDKPPAGSPLDERFGGRRKG